MLPEPSIGVVGGALWPVLRLIGFRWLALAFSFVGKNQHDGGSGSRGSGDLRS